MRCSRSARSARTRHSSSVRRNEAVADSISVEFASRPAGILAGRTPGRFTRVSGIVRAVRVVARGNRLIGRLCDADEARCRRSPWSAGVPAVETTVVRLDAADDQHGLEPVDSGQRARRTHPSGPPTRRTRVVSERRTRPGRRVGRRNLRGQIVARELARARPKEGKWSGKIPDHSLRRSVW